MFDPIELVRENRGKYLAAVFTIARAFVAAGCPKPEGMKRVAGFDSWSVAVQQPLMWLERKDPFGAMEEAIATDSSREDLRRLLEALDRYLPHDEFTTADCHKLAEEKESGGTYGYERYKYPAMRELMTFKGSINPTAFGNLLRAHVDQKISYKEGDTIRELKYTRLRKIGHAMMYKLLGRKPKP